MLEIGNGHMTDEEYRTHMSLWALTAAPLLAGNDIRSMTPAIKEILMNREVLAVDQDSLGKQASPVKLGDLQIWVKQLADGSVAAGVVNMGDAETTATVKKSDLGLGTNVKSARDLWRHSSVVFRDGLYTTNIPGAWSAHASSELEADRATRNCVSHVTRFAPEDRFQSR